jgi:hypothetical protein
MAVCREQRPPNITVASGHTAACWLHASDLSPAQAKPLSGTKLNGQAKPAGTPKSRPAEPSKEG